MSGSQGGKSLNLRLNLSNRIDALAAKNAFVTLKDHKPNFQNHPTCRLINPTKSEIGVISKKILQPRTRNVTWFNPPYNASVSTNIGSKFLRIIDKCFPPSHPLRKICNRNTLKLSYSCMPNVATIISSQNKRLLTETQPNTTSVDNCNCRNKDTCPLPGKCQTNGVVYQATVKRIDNQEEQTYVGITEGAFKTRYNNHTNSFRDPKHKNRTALSKYIWKLKDSKIDFAVSWKIIKKCRGYSSHTKKCNL